MVSNYSVYPVGIEEDIIIRIRDVNPHIVCSLCFGYLIDATSIVECLHTWTWKTGLVWKRVKAAVDDNMENGKDWRCVQKVCKKCIVKHLQVSKNCPTCNVKVHETQPFLNLRADRTLQDIVYKLVPGLFENEEKRRAEFYRSRGMLMKQKEEQEENLGPKQSTIFNNPNAHQYKYDEQICLCLERHGPQHVELHNMTYKLKSLEKKFIRCSIRVLVAHLIAIIRKKLDVPRELKIQMLCGPDLLDDEMSMKQIFLMYWYEKSSPMLLFYRVEVPDG